MDLSNIDLTIVVQLIGWTLGVAVLYFGLKARVDAHDARKVDVLDCARTHGNEAVRHAEIVAELRVLKGGIKVLNEGLRAKGTIANPTQLPDAFYADDETEGG